MRYVHNKIAENDFKGWITGSFYPTGILNHDKNIEIKINHFQESTSFPAHYHSVRKTWTIVLEGAMHMIIDGDNITIGKGEYVIYGPGVVEELLATEPNTIAVSIHSPSAENDKVDVAA